MKNYSPLFFKLPLILAAIGTISNLYATLQTAQTGSQKCLARLQDSDVISLDVIPRQPNEIGRGMMSIITKEHDGNKWVAIKRMNDAPTLTPKDWAQVEDSIEIAQELHAKLGDDSPVVNVHTFEQHGNSATIKMEYLEGDNLHMHLQKQFQNSGLNEKTLGTAIDLLALAIKNTEDLAKANILNPDLKAKNMMVTQNKKGETFIKTIDPESLVRINPQSKGLDAFPLYMSGMSPEMVEFRNRVDAVESNGSSNVLIPLYGAFVRAQSMNYPLGLLIESEIIQPFRNAIQMREPFGPRILQALEDLDKLSKRLLDSNQFTRADTREATYTINRIRNELRKP